MFVSWNNNRWIPFGSIGTRPSCCTATRSLTTLLPIERPTLMFTGTRHFFQTACRCFLFLCLLLGGISGGVVPAQDSADSRVAVPSVDVQQSKRTQVDGAVGLAKAITITQKQKALRELMTMASDVATSADELYAVLQAAFPLIRETGDIAALRVALQKLTKTFQVDPITEEAKQYKEFIAACKSASALDPAVKDLVSLVERASRANRFKGLCSFYFRDWCVVVSSV